MSSRAKHDDIADELFEVRGIVTICDILLSLPEKVQQYLKAQKQHREGVKEQTNGMD